MADTVTTNVLLDNDKYYIVCFTGISDGTGESAVVKVDKSALTTAGGREAPGILTIDSIAWCMSGLAYIKVAFDHTADQTVLVLSGSGEFDFESVSGLRDPNGDGGTGDLLFTIPSGADSGSSYTVVLKVRK